jgi:hypothetical protein
MKVRLLHDKTPARKPASRAGPDPHELRTPENPLTVQCSHCRNEISRSAAIHPEAGDYALYFCGLTCYREWLTSHEWIGPRSHR